MTFNDGEDYPTVIKDAVIKIYSGETLVETLVTGTSGEAETHLATSGTYRVTIEHPNRETIDIEVIAPENNYHLFFQLANEPRRQAQTTATENLRLTADGGVRAPDGNGSLTLQATVGSEALVGETMSQAAQVTIG
jgi:subtilisin-like proprotein convertase family protein